MCGCGYSVGGVLVSTVSRYLAKHLLGATADRQLDETMRLRVGTVRAFCFYVLDKTSTDGPDPTVAKIKEALKKDAQAYARIPKSKPEPRQWYWRGRWRP